MAEGSDKREPSLWTLQELEGRVVQALSVGYCGQENGQIRAVPNQRAIRYYTTLGLLAPPTAMSGRTALYERRHLIQLVAIKKLQAQGLSLVEVQEQLGGMTAAAIERLAALPKLDPAPAERRPVERGGFWRELPSVPPAGAVGRQEAPADAARRSPRTTTLQALELSPGVRLLLSTSAVLDAAQTTAIEAAAAPLLAQVKEFGFTFKVSPSNAVEDQDD